MNEPRPFVTHERNAPIERWGDVVSWRTLLSGDRTPTDTLTVGIAELAPDAPTSGALHRHDPAEVYVILEGTGVVHIDGTDFQVERGSVVHVPGGAWHYARNTGDEVLRLLYVFAVDSFADVAYEREGERTDPDGVDPT